MIELVEACNGYGAVRVEEAKEGIKVEEKADEEVCCRSEAGNI